VLLEGFYAHLPLKRAMHAVDPLQRLRLLRHRLEEFPSELAFHAEMIDIFTSLRDLHTNYLLPDPFRGAAAVLPFRVEAFFEGGVRKFLAVVAPNFSHLTFVSGVEVLHWNGIPIERAVEIAAARHAGSNPEARFARGLAGLTARPMVISPPPDEEWVIVGYRASGGGPELELRIDWAVTGLPAERAVDPEAPEHRASALGIDLETDAVRQIHRALFAPQTIDAGAKYDASSDPLSLVRGTESIMPQVFSARAVTTSHGDFGYIRIFTFSVTDADAFVQEFIRLAGLLPQNGLIIDVRDNGGGLIYAGERLLQVLTPGRIEPERLQFINTPLTLRLCQLHRRDAFALGPWVESIERSIETAATFSAGFPLTSPDSCNAVGQRYHGPVVLITSAKCYSTTDFFAAGFQDHAIGPILGVDKNTGAGGANVWTHDLLRKMFESPAAPGPDSPFKDLPNNAGMRVAIRRSLRVGPHSGTEVEDLGIKPDFQHAMTRDDLLKRNVDLIERAAGLLAGKPVYVLAGKIVSSAAGNKLELTTKNLEWVNVSVNGRPYGSPDVRDGANSIPLGAPLTTGAVVDLQGFAKQALVAGRRLTL
jgi:C-terminal processing protease CtpA/Prc